MSKLEDALRAALAPTYQLVRLLGAGGMGSVFLARQPALKRSVAVKVLAPELAASHEARARFEREAQAVAGLSHPNVVSVYTVGELPDSTPYFVMQYVTGRSMADRVEEDGPLGIAEARRVLGEVASALAAAHAKGIVHRDIKPANILYDEESGRAMVSDFGISAVTAKAEGPDSSRLTQTGMVVGTPKYMSPEQLLAEPVTEKTDLYALGVLGFELLTGQGPFQATSTQALIAAHLRDTAPGLTKIREDVDAELEALVAHCLNKDPVQRPSADEVARRLAPGGGTLLEWPPPGLEDLLGRLPRVAGLYWAGSALLLAGALPLLLGGARLNAATESLGTALLLASSAVGLVFYLAASGVAVRLGAAAATAVRAGFAWLTLLEVVSDRQGDAGALIAGTRDFAAVPPGERSRLRRLRVIREVVLAGGGLLPFPVLVLVVIAGSSGLRAPEWAWLALVPAFASVIVFSRLYDRERRLAVPVAQVKKRARQRLDLTRLAGPWNASFEAIRQGQVLGRGPQGRANAGRWGTWLFLASVVIAALLLAPLAIAGAVGPTIWPFIDRAPFSAFAVPGPLDQRWLRSYIPSRDSSITPLAAGRAYALLDQGRGAGRFPAPPTPPRPTQPWEGPVPPGAFRGIPRARIIVDPIQLPGISIDRNEILNAAIRGFSPTELAYLERVAHAEAWKAYATVARAPAVDFLGGRFVMPFGVTAAAYGRESTGNSAMGEFGNAATLRAAFFLARGQRDSAEATLRDVIGFGFAVIDNYGSAGGADVEEGFESLRQFYDLTRNPRAALMSAAADSARIVWSERTTWEPYPKPPALGPRGVAMRILYNPAYGRPLRYTTLYTLGMSPCADLRGIVFGPDAATVQAFTDARRTLPLYDSERSYIDLLQAGPERVPDVRGRKLWQRVVVASAKVVGTLIRNRRLAGCTVVMTDAVSAGSGR